VDRRDGAPTAEGDVNAIGFAAGQAVRRPLTPSPIGILTEIAAVCSIAPQSWSGSSRRVPISWRVGEVLLMYPPMRIAEPLSGCSRSPFFISSSFLRRGWRAMAMTDGRRCERGRSVDRHRLGTGPDRRDLICAAA
jgi:hypothetical protein